MITQKDTEMEDLKKYIDKWSAIIAIETAMFFITICILITKYGTA